MLQDEDSEHLDRDWSPDGLCRGSCLRGWSSQPINVTFCCHGFTLWL